MALDPSHIAAAFGQEHGSLSGMQPLVAKVDMYAVHVRLPGNEPSAGGIVEPGGILRFQPSVELVSVELPPALVENGIADDTGVIIQMHLGLDGTGFKNV